MAPEPEPYSSQALAAWPRFLLTHAGFGLVLGLAFTAALLALDAHGIASLIFAGETQAAPIAALALSSASLATCGSLATAMLQFHAYAGPQPAGASRRSPHS
ncbi:hypothetical protein GCM10007036_34920 [Alsobacter metallidurans]|uniref:Uncharacterized protein n=1 Tax=Alsobacter metallidurans TaxID=340221 RepID=A0A917I9R1_9HYPH|nr:hypothetical protein [Alsobacter metallidurans]GGH26820.1 hypothetical protein GCM10007036_34920 [Alsobacter metallidurans]